MLAEQDSKRHDLFVFVCFLINFNVLIYHMFCLIQFHLKITVSKEKIIFFSVHICIYIYFILFYFFSLQVTLSADNVYQRFQH